MGEYQETKIWMFQTPNLKKFLKFSDNDSNVTSTEFGNTKVVREYFANIFNRKVAVDWEHTEKTTQKDSF